jgi:hypothetical protein
MSDLFRLGKKPARPGAVQLRLGTYLDRPALPTPPAVFGEEALWPADWGLLGNDLYADCCWAGADHESMLWGAMGGVRAVFTKATALADYSSAAGFDFSDASTDQGTDLQAAASYRRKTGIIDAAGNRHLIGAYAAIEPGNLEEHLTAAWLFGACGVGLTIGDNQIQQFLAGQPWDGQLGPNSGGHYVPLIGFRGGYLLVVTFGKVQQMTPEFLVANEDEALAYLSTEALKDGDGPTGLDLVALTADLAALTA